MSPAFMKKLKAYGKLSFGGEPDDESESELNRTFKTWKRIEEAGHFWDYQGQQDKKTGAPDGKCIIIEPGQHMTVARFKKGIVHGHFIKIDRMGHLEEGNNDPEYQSENESFSLTEDSHIDEYKIFKGMHNKINDIWSFR